MDIYILEVKGKMMCFIEYTPGYMLCIGTKEEFDNASPEKIERMVWESIAIATGGNLPATPIQRPARGVQ